MPSDALPDIPAPPNLFGENPTDRRSGAGDPTPDVGAVTAAQRAAEPEELLSGETGRVEAQVLRILAAAQHREVADLTDHERAPDGSTVLDSMDAVFVVQIVEQSLGGAPLTLRGNSEPDDFRSTLALARLLTRLLVSRRATA